MRLAISGLVIIVATLSTAATPARAQGTEKGSFGAGLMAGEPTGITARLYLNDDNAIQAAIGSAFVADGFQGHADYCWHPWILTERDTFTLPVYVGPGLRVIRYDGGRGSSEKFYALGLRAVLGIVFDFKTVPLDAFLEIAPVAEYAFGEGNGGFDVTLNGGAGVRYYF
jgi:hypothetical protein